MPNQYYIDGTSLQNATAVYLDEALTQCAPQGYYEMDGLVRYQQITSAGCLLQAAQVCPACASGCGGSIDASGQEGLYITTLDVGGNDDDVGVMVVAMNPGGIADGLRVEFGDIAVTKGVRNFVNGADQGAPGNVDNCIIDTVGSAFTNEGGLAQTSGNSGYTFIGIEYAGAVQDFYCCACPGDEEENQLEGNKVLNVFEYDGTNYVATGETETMFIDDRDVVLQLPAETRGQPADVYNRVRPGQLVYCIPKTTATPSLLTIKIAGPCGDTGWTLDVKCPVEMTGFASITAASNTRDLACTAPMTGTLYAIDTLTLTPTIYPTDRNFIFLDPFGEQPAPDGFWSYVGPEGQRYTFETVDGLFRVGSIEDC